MKNTLRTLLIAALASTGLAASAQNTIYVVGSMTPCSPALLNTPVTITVAGYTGQMVTGTALLNENCSYYLEMNVPDTAGYVAVSASCGSGSITSDSSSYVLTPPFTVDVVINLACGGAPSCQACMTVEQGAAFTGLFTSCTVGAEPFTYLWDFSGPGGGGVPGDSVSHTFPGPGTYAACLNITDAAGSFCNTCQSVVVDADGNINAPVPTPCHACYTVVQANNGNQDVPFTIATTNCTSGGTAPYTYSWSFGDNTTNPGEDVVHTYAGPGVYLLCLTISSADGCTDNICQYVVVDADGNINPSPAPCNADFWIVQAYTTDPVSGDPTPVPNELWAWNLSSNLDTASFHWEFGDGESSDEAFPTHVYPSNGPFELCLTVTSGGCTDTFCDSVSVDGDGIIRDGGGFTLSVLQQAPTGITEHSALNGITTYPNPVMDELNISLNSMLKGSATIELMDINGRMVSSAAHVLSTGKNLFSTAVNTLTPGLYTVRVSNGSQQLSQRFVKTR